MADIDRYALFGHPVSHSRSPDIHHAFAEQTGEPLHYELIDVHPDQFASRVRGFIDAGGLGGNVTLPHKIAAFELADRLSQDAERAGAVNTLAVLDDDRIFGDNTDGAGLLHDLSVNHGITLEGSRILLIGAGGAARGAIGPLLDSHPDELVIANRHAGKAALLAQLFEETGPVRGVALDNARGPFDLVINATSASLRGELPALHDDVVAAHTCAYDMVYLDAPTVFLDWARRLDARHCLDGWGMMVEQAAESFLVWRGIRPDTRRLLTH